MAPERKPIKRHMEDYQHYIDDIRIEKQSHGTTGTIKIKIKVDKEAVGHHVHLPLGWMDGRTWYQLATFLSQSYCMVSSHVSRMKHVKGDGM
jgi:hypothetical protein